MVAPSAGVFPQISVRWRQVGLRIPHGEVGVLPGAALLHHLVVVLGLEPDHQYTIIIQTTLKGRSNLNHLSPNFWTHPKL